MVYENKNIEEKLCLLKEDVKKNFSDEELYLKPVYCTPDLWNTRLYNFCINLYKGADLHVHGGAMVPASKLIDFLYDRDDILIDTDYNHKGYLGLSSKKLPDTYIKIKEAINENFISRSELINLWTLQGRPDNVDVWDWFQDLFDKHNDINEVGPVCFDYFKFAYNYYCSLNINIIEMRLFLLGSTRDAKNKLKCVYDAFLETKKENPYFCVKVIPVGLKNKEFGFDATKIIFNNTKKLYKKYKNEYGNFVSGIDLVNEEDSGYSLTVFNDLINSVSELDPNLGLYLHAGETNNPNNNQIEIALNLGAKRLGHGLNLHYFPDLKKQIIANDVCLEICPISNQTLNYVKDMRKHPARKYFSQGVSITLCSDDPTYQENETLVDDFFTAIISWDLCFEDVIKLCVNSIKYSSVVDTYKIYYINLFKSLISSFIEDFNEDNE